MNFNALFFYFPAKESSRVAAAHTPAPLRRRQYSCTLKVVEFTDSPIHQFTDSPIHRAIFKTNAKIC